MTTVECFIWKWIICPIMGHAKSVKCVFGDEYICFYCGRMHRYEDINTSVFRRKKRKENRRAKEGE